MAQTIAQPVTIDAKGNIIVHARGGLSFPVTFRDSDGVFEDVSASELYFEVDGKFRVALEPGADPHSRDVVLGRNLVATLGNSENPKNFVLLDETGRVPTALWEGKIWSRGFKTEPPSE